LSNEIPPPIVSLQRVSLRSADRVWFSGTDWEIREGEHWAIRGPNGSGKSLLASALAGQVLVAEGSITYRLAGEAVPAHDLAATFARRGQVALVSLAQQQVLAAKYAGYHQARWNSSEANEGPAVEDLLSHHSIFAINPFEVLPKLDDHGAFETRRERASRLLGLGSLLRRKIKQLSNGEMRRLLLARAIAAGPRLLILDDAFAGLDRAGREQLRRLFDELARELTLVIATARLDEIPSCITHVIEVDRGRVTARHRRSASERDAETPSAIAGRPSLPAGQPEGEALVEMNGVTVHYGNTVILDDVSFSLHRGEHCALLGPNGAGKSTLLSLLLGDNPQAYANDVRLFGKRRGSGESIWDIKSRIGWVAPELLVHYPQGWPCFEVVLSGFFASVGLFEMGRPEQAERARRVLTWLGLSSAADRPLHDLSHGNQRMILLGRALVSQPDLLLLDEPCQGLDPDHTAMVNQAVDRAARELDTTSIYVTHHEHELPSCVTRVMRLQSGRVRS
jgi:molybdate transport system ATP-binding protein